MVDVGAIDENRMLLLEDGHCLKDHALSACNRPELRAEAAMMGTSLHTLVQMVDNGLGLTFVPAMAIEAGILDGTGVDARPLRSEHGFRRIALVWRRSSPRESEFQLLADSLRAIVRDVIPGQSAVTVQAELARHQLSALRPRSCGTAAAPRGGELAAPRRPNRHSAGTGSAMPLPTLRRFCRRGRSGRRSSPWSRPLMKSRTNFSSLPFSA